MNGYLHMLVRQKSFQSKPDQHVDWFVPALSGRCQRHSDTAGTVFMIL